MAAGSNWNRSALPSPVNSSHISPMPKSPRDPAKHSKKDPARPTRAKAHRPDAPPADAALERLLNPGIERGTAGMGSGPGLQQPPDNSFERRADRRGEHTARKSVVKGFDEAPQH